MPVNIEIYKKSNEHNKLLDRFVKESKKDIRIGASLLDTKHREDETEKKKK